jgi:exonuclease III
LIIGTNKNNIDYSQTLFPEIEKGASQLQTLVDEFNDLEMGDLEDDEYLNLIVDMDELISVKKNKLDSIQLKAIKSSDITSVKKLRSALSENPYTVFQNLELTRLKPISQIYYLENGKIKINTKEARKYTDKTQLFPSDFNIDNLSIWKKEISAEDVLANYTKYRSTTAFKFEKNIKKLNVGDWNIWHGGKHFSIKDFGWDSRNRIVEVIKKNNIDVLLMQETYSSGDYIAAELGYYFATTSDWDYCYQGSNVSVISRYPIKELLVPLEASFMNVGAKIAISETQEIYAMSNWYGMGSFPIVYDFHKERFDKADEIPIIFGGDFNAIPNSDGGENPASITLIENGFKDAYRSLHPDVKIFPGYTHEWGERIDQIYYKGKGLKNTSTEVISTAFGGFPSDHFMIFSKFELNY